MLKIAFSDVYIHPLPDGHKFPMSKYSLIPERLLNEGTITEENIFSPDPLDEEIIVLTHDSTYWSRLKSLELTKSKIRRIGFPVSEGLVHREIVISNGSIQNALYALQYGVSINVAGGTHHAFTNRGEGFCLLNDIAMAANYLLHKNLVKKILVVDLDVHQGNGTAQIFAEKPEVFTFSMHGKNNFPFMKESSDLDIPLSDGTGDDEYLSILYDNLTKLIDTVRPDFIFYQAGVDILQTDQYGKLAVSPDGCKQRDKIVFQNCLQHNIPVAVSMGGGYSKDIEIIVDAHCNTYRTAQDIFFNSVTTSYLNRPV